MAEPDALRRLTRGLAEWNAFREERPGPVDLTHVEIRNADLHGANFQDVDLDGSILVNVDLRGGDLRRARLNGITASRTSLEGADLDGAELKGADLKWVSLRRARLRGTQAFDLKIRHSSLVGADLAGAELRLAHVYNSDVREARFEGIRTEHVVFKRAAVEPERIPGLQASGVVLELVNMPTIAEWNDWDQFAVQARGDEMGLVIHEGQAYWINENRWDFFVSHAGPDKETVARPLAAALTQRDQRVWFDRSEVRVGDDLAEVIERGIAGSLFGVIVLSEHFFGRRWTEAELDALSRKRMFLVLHGVSPESLRGLRPGLEDRVSVSTAMGIPRVADELIAAIRALPRGS